MNCMVISTDALQFHLICINHRNSESCTLKLTLIWTMIVTRCFYFIAAVDVFDDPSPRVVVRCLDGTVPNVILHHRHGLAHVATHATQGQRLAGGGGIPAIFRG